METKEQKSFFETLWLKLRPVIIGMLIGVLFMLQCGRKQDAMQRVPKQLYDSLEAEYGVLKKETAMHLKKVEILEKEVKRLDSIKQKVKIEYQVAKKDNRISIIENICDTAKVLKAYDNTVAKCDSVIRVCEDEHVVKDSVIVEQKEAIESQAKTILNRDQTVQLKDIDLKLANTEVRRQRRGKVAAVIVGIITTVGGIVGTVFIMK